MTAGRSRGRRQATGSEQTSRSSGPAMPAFPVCRAGWPRLLVTRRVGRAQAGAVGCLVFLIRPPGPGRSMTTSSRCTPISRARRQPRLRLRRLRLPCLRPRRPRLRPRRRSAEPWLDSREYARPLYPPEDPLAPRGPSGPDSPGRRSRRDSGSPTRRVVPGAAALSGGTALDRTTPADRTRADYGLPPDRSPARQPWPDATPEAGRFGPGGTPAHCQYAGAAPIPMTPTVETALAG